MPQSRAPALHPGPSGPAATVIRQRRTIHAFEDKVPPKEAVVQAIELARWAPNHHLTQPWSFYLLGRETAASIAQLNARLVAAATGPNAARAKLERWRKIPGWLVVTCRRSADEIRAREDYAACCCAIQNFQLALWEQGIGVKWTTGEVTRETGFYELIGADPDREQVVGLLWYGYPAVIPRTEREPVAAIVIERP